MSLLTSPSTGHPQWGRGRAQVHSGCRLPLPVFIPQGCCEMLGALDAVGVRDLFHGSPGLGDQGFLEGLVQSCPPSGSSRRTAMA